MLNDSKKKKKKKKGEQYKPYCLLQVLVIGVRNSSSNSCSSEHAVRYILWHQGSVRSKALSILAFDVLVDVLQVGSELFQRIPRHRMKEVLDFIVAQFCHSPIAEESSHEHTIDQRYTRG